MKCAELRAMAESYLAGELPADTNHTVITHLERCANCSTELDARVQLRQTLRRAFLQSEALAPTEAFIGRVRTSLANDAGGRRRWFGRPGPWLAIAAGVALVFALGWQMLPLDRVSVTSPAPTVGQVRPLHQDRVPVTSPGLAALAAHAAGDHRDCALQHALEDPPISLEEAARQYDPAYATLRDVVSQSAPVRDDAVEILGAHWCVFRGRPFAHVVVRRQGHVVSILLTPVDHTPPTLASATLCPSSEGFQVACFDAPGHAGFVVSDLTDSENLALARHLAPVLQTYLARG